MKYDAKGTFTLFTRLYSDNSKFKDELFDWISFGLDSTYDRARMIKVIDQEYEFLVRILQNLIFELSNFSVKIKEDHEKFSELIKNLTIEEQMSFIMKYKPTTKSKLIIFENILDFVKFKHMENEITNAFKIEYINLLNIHKKSKVLPELMTGKYPPSECLEKCEKANNELAIAYLKERLGFYDESLAIYKKRLRKTLKALSRGGRNKHKIKNLLLTNRIERESEMALDLCHNSENPERVSLFSPIFTNFDHVLDAVRVDGVHDQD